MKQISLAELKKIELDILSQVHDLCQQLNLRYSLAGGTLLGAIRHGGFIPWDDDIDIFMPRPDYDKLIEYCKNNSIPFSLVSNDSNSRYGYLFAKAMCKETFIVEQNANRFNIEMGVYIDIFPIDGLGTTYEEAIKNFNKTSFKRELLVATNWKRFFRSKTRSLKYEPIRLAFFILSRFTSPKRLVPIIEKKTKEIAFDDSNFAGAVCGAYRTKEILESSIYSEYTDIVFENKLFRAIKNSDAYLSSIYGNYMELPPVEKRVSHHTFIAYLK